MNRSTHLLLLLCTGMMTACDPAIGVHIANKTNASREVQVIYPANYALRKDTMSSIPMGSIYTYDPSTEEGYTSRILTQAVLLDSTTRKYSFVLPAGHEAVVEKRFLAMYPTYGQVFIIDNKDTVELTRKKSSFVKRPKLTFGGTWTYAIK